MSTALSVFFLLPKNLNRKTHELHKIAFDLGVLRVVVVKCFAWLTL
jgi:hypothetical protein